MRVQRTTQKGRITDPPPPGEVLRVGPGVRSVKLDRVYAHALRDLERLLRMQGVAYRTSLPLSDSDRGSRVQPDEGEVKAQ
jgi:hypothetical protein